MAGEMTVTKANDGQTLSPRVGEAIVLQLAERPTTGFRWAFAQLDEALVAVEASASRAQAERPGAGRVAAWKLTMRAPGRTRVELKLWRSWEGDRSVAERFALTLDIRA
jgi:inhibitor of cysteine peptidase